MKSSHWAMAYRLSLPTLRSTIAVFAITICTPILIACHNNNAEKQSPQLPTDEEIVQMYNHYIHREYGVYVDQMESLDNKPESYRKQTVELMKQLRHRQDSLNGGPISCRVMKTEPSHDGSYCSVFLEITFKDRSFEQILLPMVRKDEIWRLK